MNYYNDNDHFVAEWLRNLIKADLIGNGVVDERSIHGVSGKHLNEYTRCHFFAGIAGWELALNLAGWPTDAPVWTGSCPCQPFSAAGKRKADEDERHLWPSWFDLIRVCRPPTIFGEQVEAAIGMGWLDRVFDDLEEEGYTCGAAVLPACSIGAPHIRSRLFWVANSEVPRWRLEHAEDIGKTDREINASANSGESAGRMAESNGRGCGEKWNSQRLSQVCERGTNQRLSLESASANGGMADSQDDHWGTRECETEAGARANRERRRGSPSGRSNGRLDNTASDGTGCGDAAEQGSNGQDDGLSGQAGSSDGMGYAPIRGLEWSWLQIWNSGPSKKSHWKDSQWIYCRDGKYRRIPVKSSLQPLAARIPGRVGMLRGAGNAIVPQVAAEFIKAFMGIL